MIQQDAIYIQSNKEVFAMDQRLISIPGDKFKLILIKAKHSMEYAQTIQSIFQQRMTKNGTQMFVAIKDFHKQNYRKFCYWQENGKTMVKDILNKEIEAIPNETSVLVSKDSQNIVKQLQEEIVSLKQKIANLEKTLEGMVAKDRVSEINRNNKQSLIKLLCQLIEKQENETNIILKKSQWNSKKEQQSQKDEQEPVKKELTNNEIPQEAGSIEPDKQVNEQIPSKEQNKPFEESNKSVVNSQVISFLNSETNGVWGARSNQQQISAKSGKSPRSEQLNIRQEHI